MLRSGIKMSLVQVDVKALTRLCLFMPVCSARVSVRSYDERSAGSTAVSEEDDPFEAPFFPFADDGPFMNE